MMNYFTLFGLPVSLKVDQAQLTKSYYTLSRQYHPDHAIGRKESDTTEAEQMSATINKGRQVLSSRELRLEHLLSLEGIIQEEEKYALPAAFLGEMMDINEALTDLEFDADPSKLEHVKEELSQMEETIFKPVAGYFEQQEFVLDETSSALLKAYYYKQKYLHRIKERIIRML